MADAKISALTTKATPVAADITNILDSAASNADKKATLSSLQGAIISPRIVFTDAGAVGAKTITISPANPGGASHANYQISVAAAATGVDEAINIGYNIGEVDATEPAMGLIQEIDYVSTARGAASQRVMEWYAQFSGSTSGGSGGTNAPRTWFCAFEPGDTSVGTEVGQILYSYIATGYNRFFTGAAGSGGLRIGIDFNGSASGGGGLDSEGYGFIDVDGPRFAQLRACNHIATLSAASPANPCVITVASGHGINVGAKIQIFKPDANGWMERDWNTGAAVVGTVTVATATQLTLSGINNTSLGITNGYGWQLARPTATAFAPAFQYLSVGTSSVGSVPFTFTLAGSAGFMGSLGIASAGHVAAVSGSISSSDFYSPSLLAFRTTDTTGTGTRQMIVAYAGTGTGFSIGFPDDATGDNLDNFLMGIGHPQSSDAAYTVLKTSLCCFVSNSNNAGLVGIGGISPYNRAKLVVAAGTTAHAQIGLATSTLKTTPVVGDIAFDGTNFRACVSAGVWGTITVT